MTGRLRDGRDYGSAPRRMLEFSINVGSRAIQARTSRHSPGCTAVFGPPYFASALNARRYGLTDMTDPCHSAPPVPPVEPEPWQCCGSGCDPCVYDTYWQQLERYEQELERWRERAAGRSGGERSAFDKGGGTP
ncbi:MAG: oxidoreductase-like domain-containing protein [Rhodospirillaceae bacterium]